MLSLIGWAHTQNGPQYCVDLHNENVCWSGNSIPTVEKKSLPSGPNPTKVSRSSAHPKVKVKSAGDEDFPVDQSAMWFLILSG